jgi:hypothetical protein
VKVGRRPLLDSEVVQRVLPSRTSRRYRQGTAVRGTHHFRGIRWFPVITSMSESNPPIAAALTAKFGVTFPCCKASLMFEASSPFTRLLDLSPMLPRVTTCEQHMRGQVVMLPSLASLSQIPSFQCLSQASHNPLVENSWGSPSHAAVFVCLCATTCEGDSILQPSSPHRNSRIARACGDQIDQGHY